MSAVLDSIGFTIDRDLGIIQTKYVDKIEIKKKN